MSLKSVYLPQPVIEEQRIRVTGDEHHHLSVARVQEGESVEVFDGNGQVWLTLVLQHNRRETLLTVMDHRTVERDPHEVILGLAMIRTSAFEFALEKSVEAGVTRIIPFVARRSNFALSKKPARWPRIVVEAAKQSKRYYLPALDEPMRFEQILAVDARSKIVFAERGGGPLKSAVAGSPVLYLVGPEGGWDDEELDTATRAGFVRVGLGSGILRSETAAIVGAALIRYELQSV
jgi:16S rRNA (uracil1498-N3)-methyltransferase